MTRPRHPRTARTGFTLVELLVATALVILILTILAVAFGAASDSLSRLRATGNMATSLRTTQDRLRADLEAPHLDPGDSPGPLQLADVKYNLLAPGGTQAQPPFAGYFRIDSGAVGSKFEGQDQEGMLSTRADGTTGNSIEFTTKLQGRTPDDLFVVPATTAGLLAQSVSDTPLAPGLFAGKWSRVKWYLDNPQVAGTTGVQVWTLYRCVRVVAPGNVAGLTADEQDLFAHTGGTTRTLTELMNPVNRLPLLRYGAGGTPSNFIGDDIVLTNVTSFEVKPAWDAPQPLGSTPREARSTSGNVNRQLPAALTPGTAINDTFGTTANSDAPFDDLPTVTENTTLANQRVFDTWAPLTGPAGSWNDGQTTPSANAIPLRIRVTALQVKIRVFDPKTLLSRQVSFIVQP